MTNAEKYLKDKNYTKDFVSDYMIYCVRKKQDSVNLESLSLFFREEAKPTLTEDERVVLKNIDKKFIKIGRDASNTIYFIFDEFTGMKAKYYANIFDNIFQFIKERRRIQNKRIVGR